MVTSSDRTVEALGRKEGLTLGIVTAYPPSRASLNEYGTHLTEALRRDPRVSKVRVFGDEVLEPEVAQGSSAGRVPLEIERCWTFDGYNNMTRILRAVHRAKPDAVLINAHFRSFGDRSFASALGLLTAPALRVLRVPTVLILHNIVEAVDLVGTGFVKSRAAAWFSAAAGTGLTRLLLSSHRVSVLLPNYHRILQDKYGVDNIMHVPHGALGEVRKKPATIPPGPARILAFGKFGTYKKVELLLDAAKILRDQGRHDFEVVIAGTDSPNTPGYLDSVKERYAGMPRVTFTGYLPEELVQPTLASATVIVLPYTSTTGSSGVLHQVGQVGRAAVLPDLGDLSVLIRAEGYTGEIFEPHSAPSLAAAIGKLLDDPDYRRAMELTNLKASGAFGIGDAAGRYVDEVTKICGPVRKREASAKGQRTEKLPA